MKVNGATSTLFTENQVIEKLLPSITDKLDVGLIILDQNARILGWNRWFTTHSEIPAEDAVGSRLQEIFPTLSNSRITVAIEQAIQYGMSSLLSPTFNKTIFPLKKKEDQTNADHALKQLITIKALPDSEFSHNCLIQIIDVTSADRREKIMKNQARELEQSNFDLSQFAYIASHDLQEPLRTIKCFGDLLIAEYREALDHEGRQHMERIVNSTSRLQAMVTDLLAYSEVSTQELQAEKVNINEVLKDLQIELQIKLQETGATLNIDQIPPVRGSAGQLHQLFQNLIGNSLKFAKPDVPPVISLAIGRAPDRKLVRIILSDNGIGFDQKYAERIFNISERLNDRKYYPGNGIGLAICQRIVERHRGSIRASGVLDEGAAFTIDLPRFT